jgi:hypothetical protein
MYGWISGEVWLQGCYQDFVSLHSLAPSSIIFYYNLGLSFYDYGRSCGNGMDGVREESVPGRRGRAWGMWSTGEKRRGVWDSLKIDIYSRRQI